METYGVDYTYALRKAFLSSVDVLGSSGRAALIEALQREDVDIESPSLSVDELRYGLLKMLGPDTTDLIMGIIFSKIERIHDWR